VPLNALNKHQGVTDLQSAQSLEAGPRIGANGKKAGGHESDPRLVAGNKALKGEPHGRYQLKRAGRRPEKESARRLGKPGSATYWVGKPRVSGLRMTESAVGDGTSREQLQPLLWLQRHAW